MPEAIAQLRPVADNTLEGESSVVVPPGTDNSIDRIEGGARRGDNLFHSFEIFHVDRGRAAYFVDPGVENILGRVTGDAPSQILGVLGTTGDANLFLINPNGIIFGDRSSLDVGGSFTATTADAVQFGEQGEFSASNPSAPALLTIQPSAFLFTQLSPAAITNNSLISISESPGTPAEGGLRVDNGQGLTLLGGDIRTNQGGLTALGGRVDVGGLGQPGEVAINADGSLDFPNGAVRADVSMASGSLIDVLDTTVSGGRVNVEARSLEIIESNITAGTAAGSSFLEGEAGDITIDANSIRGTDALVDNSVLGLEGNSGNILIKSRDRILLENSNIFSTVGTPSDKTVAVGDSGNIEIETDSLTLTNNSDIVASTFGRGDAGSVVINASSQVALNDNSDIFSDVGAAGSEAIATGNGGNIEIITNTLTLTNNSDLTAGVFGEGSAGNIIINASSQIALDDNSDIFSDVGALSTEAIAIGDGGNIEITTDTLTLTNNSDLDASTFGRGNAGNIIIKASDRVTLNNNSDIFSDVGAANTETVALGNGGNIEIETDTLTLSDNSDLTASTFGEGSAGNIVINASDRVTLNDNSDIFSDVGALSTEAIAIGNGGNIEIETDILTLTNNSNLDASTFGRGSAGNVNLTANVVQLADQSIIATENNRGDGGNITLSGAKLLLLRNGSLISATAGTEEAGGDGGNVDIAADLIVAVPDENSDIRANAFSGSGGNVQIDAQSLIGIAEGMQENPSASEITASSALGASGTVDIATLELNPDNGLTELPAIFEDVSDQITQACYSSSGEDNEFIITGRGGLPSSPIDPLVGESPLTNWVVLDEPTQLSSTWHLDGTSVTSAIAEAQGWTRGSDGAVRLVATTDLKLQHSCHLPL